MERLRELYDNFPKELRYILDGRIEDLLDTLPPLDIRFENSRFKIKTTPINANISSVKRGEDAMNLSVDEMMTLPPREENVATTNGIVEKGIVFSPEKTTELDACKQMECPYCKSSNVKNLKVHISKPIGAKKYKCFVCNKSFIVKPDLSEQNVDFSNGIGEKFHDEISDVIVLSSKDGHVYKLSKENKIPTEAAEFDANDKTGEKIAEKFDSTRCLFLAKGYNPVVPEIISRETVSTNEN